MTIYGNENNETIMMELGQRIRDTRIRMQITQAGMAEQSGVAIRTIVRMEKGESVYLDSMLNVLRVLGVLENLNLLLQEQELAPHSFAATYVRF
ncbi:hypothetical protein ABXS75_00010 [Roseburia hominis]